MVHVLIVIVLLAYFQGVRFVSLYLISLILEGFVLIRIVFGLWMVVVSNVPLDLDLMLINFVLVPISQHRVLRIMVKRYRLRLLQLIIKLNHLPTLRLKLSHPRHLKHLKHLKHLNNLQLPSGTAKLNLTGSVLVVMQDFLQMGKEVARGLSWGVLLWMLLKKTASDAYQVTL